MNCILFDDERIHQFLPLTHTRPVGDLRCGILTMHQRWQKFTGISFSYKTADYLQEKFPFTSGDDNLFINSALFPDDNLWSAMKNIGIGECVMKNNIILFARMGMHEANSFDWANMPSFFKVREFEDEPKMINQPWDLFGMNDFAIRYDFDLMTKGNISAPLSSTNTLLGHDVFIEEGAHVECSIINTISGPVYIGRDAEVMEGCMIRGPFALGEHGVLKMGAKIYGATTVGDGCKVGGEVNNSIFYGNSSKAHDGFIGNAVIGEWCNIGADTNNSNLKNNYEEVKLWNEYKKTFVKTGLQFCGLIMGDHSKCGINTMLNTGTVIGVSCNVYGAGFPRNFIPSFSWGSANGFMEYQLSKAVDTAKRVFARRQLEFNETEQRLLSQVFERTQVQRNYQ